MGRLTSWWLGSTSSCAMALLLPYILPPPGFTMRSTSLFHCLRHSLVLLLGPFTRTTGEGFLVPHHHLGMSAFFPCVPSLHIGTDSQSLQRKEHRQMLCVPKPHNLESWPPCFGHITVPRRWEGSRLQRARLLKGLTTSTQKSLTVGTHLSLYCSSLQ